MANEMTHSASSAPPSIGNRFMKIVAIFGVTLGAISCASFSSTEWRNGHVIRVLRSREVIPDVDLRCIDAAPRRTDHAIALVKIRIGRAPYEIAVPFDHQLALVPGERVAVHMTSCQIRRRTH
jgi:hypothetical protein